MLFDPIESLQKVVYFIFRQGGLKSKLPVLLCFADRTFFFDHYTQLTDSSQQQVKDHTLHTIPVRTFPLFNICKVSLRGFQTNAISLTSLFLFALVVNQQ
ncbi:hypothetical protein XENOCAPTIV_011122 [Xenoophorus captivus]|uniref:Uncharacterized protein n=1 Tax=Xenoophorus captivus TaxID=1517983 RepID=A0ABV0SCW5_9TELE